MIGQPVRSWELETSDAIYQLDRWHPDKRVVSLANKMWKAMRLHDHDLASLKKSFPISIKMFDRNLILNQIHK